MNVHSDRGAILVHVAIAMLALMTLSAFTVDYGQFFVARRQAQNAADAGALAGVVARIYDDPSSPPASKTSGPVPDSVFATVAQNRIWGAASPANTVQIDWLCPNDGSTNCVVVDVYRDGSNNSNPLSTFFLGFVNVNTQGMRAHAVGQIQGANATGCMRPWFLIDRYVEVNGTPGYNTGDTYTSPGYRVPEDIGTLVDFSANISPSGYGQVDVANGTNGLNDAIRHCADGTYVIGQEFPAKPGGSNGQKHGIEDVMGWDTGATFNPSTGKVEGGCAPSCTCDGDPLCPYGGKISPRVMIVPVCSPLESECAQGGQNNDVITITNFLSFFMESYDEHDTIIHARLIGTAGEIDSSGAPAPVNGSFLKTPVLIR